MAAPNPLSMLTTVTPDAHELSIASSADRPPNEAPYPTLVGTAMTGAFTNPPTTLGSAPSMPATMITTAASRSASWADLLFGESALTRTGSGDFQGLVMRGIIGGVGEVGTILGR